MVSQKRWRIAGGSCLVLCMIMAAGSFNLAHPDISAWVMLGYWGLFLLLLVVALYIAVLDVRYTRMRYKMTERELFRDTFMTPEFRQAIQDALKDQEQQRKDELN